MPLPPQWNEENCEKVEGYVEEAERGADQAHVVVLRKPADDDGGSVGVESGDDRVHVAMEVGDGDHDAFGEGGAARRVLEEAERRWGEGKSRLV